MRRFTSVPVLVLLLLAPLLRISAQGTLPKDVDPESRNRLPAAKRDSLDEPGKKAYDDAVAGFPGAHPGMSAMLRLNGYQGNIVQAESPLGLPLMQLAILTTAREHDQPYEWSLHEMQAVAVGLDREVIDVVRNRKPLGKIGDKEAAIIQIGREVFGSQRRLTSETYARAVKALGQSNLVDVAGLMSDYTRTSATLSAFNQQLPPGWRQLLPLPFTLPNDIHPDSRSRLPLITGPAPPPAAGSFQLALYGRELAPKGTGPATIRRHGAGLRSLEASVGRQTIDLAILVAAREHDSQYDWTMNELAAIHDGLDPALIDTVRNRNVVAGLGPKDACIIEFGRELFQKHYLSPETYSCAVKMFGEKDLVDLVDVMALHAKEAMLLAVFDQHLPEGQKPLLPASSH